MRFARWLRWFAEAVAYDPWPKRGTAICEHCSISGLATVSMSIEKMIGHIEAHEDQAPGRNVRVRLTAVSRG